MISRIVHQQRTTLAAGNSTASTAGAAFTAGIVPYTGSILRRFSSGLRRSSGGTGRRHSRRWCSTGLLSQLVVESLVVHISRTADRAVALCRTTTALTVLGADIVLYTTR